MKLNVAHLIVSQPTQPEHLSSTTPQPLTGHRRQTEVAACDWNAPPFAFRLTPVYLADSLTVTPPDLLLKFSVPEVGDEE